jgi:TRAP-type C4-dicarboxylate transport system permease large subunit
MFAEVFRKNCAPGLTRKAVYERLSTVNDKLTKRDWICLILIALAVLVLGLLESNPNH